MNQLKKVLTSQLKQISTSPFLFVGSGFSQRYLGLETWEKLLRRFCVDPQKPFEYYSGSCNKNLQEVGSQLALDFHETWWKEKKYKKNRDLYMPESQVSQSSALKIEIADYMKKKSSKILTNHAKEVDLLKQMTNLQGIITTNYDLFLETVIPDFPTFIGQEDLLFSNAYGVGEIYKLHGCCQKPNSLVLTTQDYEEFEEKNAYLISKLLTFFVEHPIIFLGYSLSDPHILKIFKRIVTCLGRENIQKLANKIIFVEWKQEPDIYTCVSTNFPTDKFPLPITKVDCSSFEPVFESILTIERKIPVKVLRTCQEKIFQLVIAKNQEELEEKKVFLINFDQQKNVQDLDFVIGLGVSEILSEQGYVGLKIDDVFHDIVFGDKKYDPKALLNKFFPEQLTGNAKFFPIFKYLSAEGIKSREDFDNNPDLKKLEKVVTLERKNYYTQPPVKTTFEKRSVSGVIEQFGSQKALTYLHFLSDEEINLEELGNFLKENYHLLLEKKRRQAYRKLVCLYDKLKYGF